jgi:hypothetical protein
LSAFIDEAGRPPTLTGTVVEGVKECEEGADHEDVGVLVKNHFGE